MRVRGALKVAALLTSLWASAAWAKKDEPNFHVTSRRNPPDFMNYFEESDVILFHDFREGSVYRSTDAGTRWEKVDGVPQGEAARLVLHRFDSNRAYILTEGISHYRTHDRGKTWQQFVTDSQMSVFEEDVLNFHAGNPDHIIFNGMDCQSIFCDEVAMYTTDGFESSAKFLRGNTAGCWWAKSSKLFETGDKEMDAQRILCIVRDAISPFKQDQRLLVSDNFFSAKKADGVVQEFEPFLDSDRRVQGIVNLAVQKKYLLVATTSVNTDEMALFVTDDTKRWHRAIFPTDHRVNQEAYTVLESTSYSIQIDVMTTRPSNPMGVMFTSNSNGTFFTRNIEYTNRNTRGNVDFEKVSGIQGIFLVNKVENGADVEKDPRAKKKILTEITFDDGRTFESVTAGKERIHLHSVTDIHNVGRIFSTPAPGLLMGVGNTGSHLGEYADGDLYVSDDAGLTWSEALKGPHKYEFGDQGSILLAVKEGKGVGEISFSLDHGQKWRTAGFPDGLKIRPFVLTTTQDSSSLKFILVGESEDGRWHIISIDFDGLHEATCKESDMEDWWARATGKGDGTCLMGHTQKYHRRKKNSECFLKQEFKEPVVETNDCDCQDWDFECDYNFRRDGKDCVPAGPVAAPEASCKSGKPDETFMGSNGWRLIPGNTCKRGSGKQKDALVEHKCADSHAPPPSPATGKIAQKVFEFEGDKWNAFDKYYLDRGHTSSDKEETIIARPYVTIDGKGGPGGPLYLTQDHGKTWTRPEAFKKDNIWAVVPHLYFKEMLFLVRKDGKVTYTVDYGKHWHDFTAPNPPDWDAPVPQSLMFHPDHKDWMIWLGDKCKAEGKKCRYVEASFSRDRGDNWVTLRRNVERCEFIGSKAYKYRNDTEVLCLAREGEDADKDSPRQLVSINDFLDENESVRAKNVRDFATMSEFVIVAVKNTEKKTLEALASVDGVNYVEAKFPYNFEVPHQRGYTVLDSSTHAVNLFVVTDTTDGRNIGTILRSNSNGTSYVVSIAEVNCNSLFYVDFEKMLGLEGVTLVNTVANPDDKKADKKLQTRISHNDGAEWSYLPPPAKDAEGKDFGCQRAKGDEKCALHIHGYTMREDHRKAYSSENAVGILFGLGNVGEHLGEYNEADTFMSTDAGISWKNVKKGLWTWQIGDQGSVVVLVQLHKKVRTVSFTADEGQTWNDYEFSDHDVEVLDITTFRSGVSRNFMLWCKGREGVFTVNLDFSGLTDRPCKAYDPKDPAGSDYQLWSPEHPLLKDSECLFGHKSSYLRKKTDRKCYNGFRMEHLYNQENCTCSRRDYECDYNFELDNHGACSLVQGLSPQTQEQWCAAHPDASTYYEATGYRRIPLTTCVDGTQYDRLSEPKPCPNHEEEFAREHGGPSGVAIFFAVAIPIAIAAAVGSYVYRNWSGKFGTIRLGEQGSGPGGRFSFDNDTPWVRYPVLALSAAVAVVGAIPLVVSALWRTATTAAERWGFGSGSGGGWSRLSGGGAGSTRRFTTRDSFARGRGDYAIVDEDEGELLGEDSDEDAV